MGILFLLLALLVAITALIFALGNPAVIDVTLLFWEFETSLTMVVLIGFVLGALVAGLVLMPTIIKLRVQSAKRKRAIEGLQQALPDEDRETGKKDRN